MFGDQMKRDYYLDEDTVYVNNGSMGPCPKPILQEKMRLLLEFESNAMRWLNHTEYSHLEKSLQTVANFLNGNPDNMVFVQNVTMGLQSVINGITFSTGDKVLLQTWTYKNCVFACQRAGLDIVMVDIPKPLLNEDQVIQAYKDTLSNNSNIKAVVVDLISCPTACKWPWKRLLELFTNRGMCIIIDGAHAPGHIGVDMEEFGQYGADYVVVNLHKWLFSPKGCGVIWCKDRTQNPIRPLFSGVSPTSDDIHNLFHRQATMDLTSPMVAYKSVEYFKSLGGREGIQAYTTPLLDQAVNLMVSRLGTYTFPLPESMRAPFMRTIRLPDKIMELFPEKIADNPLELVNDILDLDDLLLDKYNISSRCMYLYNEPWIRISCTVYNELYHYRKLADALLDIVNS